MSALEVVLDVVVGLHSDPVRHLSVLFDLLAESLFQLVALVGSHDRLYNSRALNLIGTGFFSLWFLAL